MQLPITTIYNRIAIIISTISTKGLMSIKEKLNLKIWQDVWTIQTAVRIIEWMAKTINKVQKIIEKISFI